MPPSGSDWDRWVSCGASIAGLSSALFVLVCAALAYGVFLLVASRMKAENAFTTILGELESMSASMRWLALVQFFRLVHAVHVFVYTTPAVAKLHFGSTLPGSPAYEAGANWVGVLFATYNGLGALAAIDHSLVRSTFRHPPTHRINLWLGAVGLLSMLLIRDPDWLLVSMIGLGFAWALHHSLAIRHVGQQPAARKMGVSMGIFNIFIVIPQLLAAGVLGWLLDVAPTAILHIRLVIAAVGLFLAGLIVLRVRETAS